MDSGGGGEYDAGTEAACTRRPEMAGRLGMLGLVLCVLAGGALGGLVPHATVFRPRSVARQVGACGEPLGQDAGGGMCRAPGGLVLNQFGDECSSDTAELGDGRGISVGDPLSMLSKVGGTLQVTQQF